jgi:response regulator RpfG family c-di-GMP phosphodiesterase
MLALSVDDEKINLVIIEEMAKALDLDIVSFSDPARALEYIRDRNNIDLVFLDYLMPEIDGIMLLREIRKYYHYQNIPVVMITGITDDNSLKLRAIREGATEFLHKPLEGAEFTARVNNLLKLRKSQILLENRALHLEEAIMEATRRIERREFEALTVLGNAAEFKERNTSEHVKRVAYYCKLLARAHGESKKDQDLIFYASPLHDVGKIGIPDSILLKPGRLNPEEWEVMKTHTTNGYQILQNSESEYLNMGAIIALTHHEKFDGSGYPYGRSGGDIHLFGRITAIADVFDALMTTRPYKEAWPFEQAVSFIREKSGKHFDPRLVECFNDNISEFINIFNEFDGRTIK